MITLRPYQSAAVEAIYDYFNNHTGHPLIVVPTAGGKSLILSEFIKSACERYPGTRILVLTHVKELIAQDHAELCSYWPLAPAGVYSAGLKRREISSQILIAGIQSIHSKAYDLQHVDLVIVDEAHLVPRTSNTMYRRFLEQLRSINPYLKIIGLTATPFRLDSGRLHEGDDAMFTDIAYDVPVTDLIKDGYLCPPVSVTSATQIDTSGVHTRGGEFVAGELEHAAMDPDVVERIIDETCARGQDRRGWLVFGCGVHHSQVMADAIRARGFSCDTIFGDTPEAERDRIIAAFKRQEIRCLCAMNVLTTGFNARHVDLIAVARPTKSTGLWIQIVGRGMRLFDGKENCLVLDFGGNIARHGPIDKPLIKKPMKGEGDAPTKTCKVCESTVPISARECPVCGAEFEVEGSKVTAKAQGGALLSTQIQSTWVAVSGVSYAKHIKPGKQPTFRVTYQCGLTSHREWICLEHTGYARQKACSWWSGRAPMLDGKPGPIPMTVDEALASSHHLRQPKQILVKPVGKFTEIVGVKL